MKEKVEIKMGKWNIKDSFLDIWYNRNKHAPNSRLFFKTFEDFQKT